MKLNYAKFDYMKMREYLTRAAAKNEIAEVIGNEVIGKMSPMAETIGNMNIPLSIHATVRERDENEIMNITNEFLKHENERRTNGDCEQQEGSCFDMALKGSKRFLEAKGYTLKKTRNNSKRG